MEDIIKFLNECIPNTNIPVVVFVLMLIIFATFTYNLIKIFKETRPIKADLEEALNFLDKFKKTFLPHNTKK